MKRAKPYSLERNAAVALGDGGTVEYTPLLEEQALADPEPPAREHAG